MSSQKFRGSFADLHAVAHTQVIARNGPAAKRARARGFQGLGFRVWGSGFRVQGLGFGVWGVGFGVSGLGFRA